MDYVSLMTLPANARGVIDEMLADVRENPRYENKGFAYEVAGAIGEYAYCEKGGFWNDNTGRAAYGITLADVTRCRRELKAIGIDLSFDDVDALLLQGLMGCDTMYPEVTDILEKYRKKTATARERARAAGKCIICFVNACAPRATCYDCGVKANAARAARKANAAQPKSKAKKPKAAARKAKPKAKASK